MNISNLKSDVYFLTRSTTASYPNSDLVRNINIAYQNTARLIWESCGGWQYDDSNSTTLPIAKGSLVHNQQDYTLPSTAQRVHEVNIKNANGEWVKLLPLDWNDIGSPAEFLKSANAPIYYDLVGRSIMLYPPPSSAYCTLASGLAVYVDRDVTEFTTTGTTTTPGFAVQFHRILSYSASLDFEQDSKQRELLIVQKDRLEKGLTRFYAKRGSEVKSVLRPSAKRAWKQYI